MGTKVDGPVNRSLLRRPDRKDHRSSRVFTDPDLPDNFPSRALGWKGKDMGKDLTSLSDGQSLGYGVQYPSSTLIGKS